MLKMFHGLRPGRGSSYFIACSDAPAMHKLMADLVLTGTNDHTTINAFLLAKGAGDFLFSTGTIFTAGTISTQAANQRLRGAGRSTLFFATNSAGSNAPIISVVHGVCFLEDFAMNGNLANNGGRSSMRLIALTGVGSCRVRKIYGNGSAGMGVDISGVVTDTALEDVIIQGCQSNNFNIAGTGGPGLGVLLRGCIAYQSVANAGFAISAGTNHHLVGCLAYGNTQYGLLDQATKTMFEGCHSYGNGSYGFYLIGTGCNISGGISHVNNMGILMGAAATGTHISGIEISENSGTGIQHDTGSGPALIVGCLIRFNGAYGVYSNSDYCAIVGNHIYSNSVAGAASYSGILFDAAADNGYIGGNKIWRGASGNRHGYGIHMNGGCINNYVGQNDLFEGGMTAEIFEGGTNTRRPVKRQLDYIAASNLLAGAVWAANTWTDVVGNQTFRVDSATSVVEIIVKGHMLLGATGTVNTETGSRIVVDSAGTPINRQLGGDNCETTTGYANPLAGGGSVFLTGLAIGNHTVKVQAVSTVIPNAYLRAVAFADEEHLSIQVVEHLGV